MDSVIQLIFNCLSWVACRQLIRFQGDQGFNFEEEEKQEKNISQDEGSTFLAFACQSGGSVIFSSN